MALRLQGMGVKQYANGFNATLHPELLNQPMAWKKPSMIFVCSMADLFHAEVPDAFIDAILDTIRATPQHTYLLLTKRAERMAQYFSTHPVPDNAWCGVTVECVATTYRINYLRMVNTKCRFLSCEPLLEDLGNIDLAGIQWVLVGGESGPSARPMAKAWVLNLMNQCAAYGATFHFKQWGNWDENGVFHRSKHDSGHLIDGREYRDFPQIN